MNASSPALQLALALCLTVSTAGLSFAQAPPSKKEPYKPVVGMAGRDAVWVPTSHAMIEKMLDFAEVTPKDFVMDLGSGDGRAIIAAARRGVRGRGVEYTPELVEFSKREATAAGVADKAEFVQGDMYAADISEATVLALFLLPSNIEKLAPTFLRQLRPGSRIVANTFWMEGWQPDETDMLENGCESWCTAHLFIIPANVEGRWTLPQGELALKQTFQMISGTLTSDGVQSHVEGRLRGDRITFSIGGAEYSGRVDGTSMEGTVTSGSGSTSWAATRQ